MTRRWMGRSVGLVALLGALSASGVALARPEAPGTFCATFPDAAQCLGRVVECGHCHTSTFPTAWNMYGLAVMGELDRDQSFVDALPDALRAIDALDSDEDGLSNAEEIASGTMPGDPGSGWTPIEPPDMTKQNPRYDVGNYDYAFAFKRVSVLYCGRSPSYDAMMFFRDGKASADDKRERLHEALADCLDSEYWRDEALARLADKRIRPQQVAGPDTEIHIGPYRIVIGDYNYDYRLWSYVLTEDRDARDLLLAQYHVITNDDGELEKVEGVLEKADETALGGGQPLPAEMRAGMITTQWFLAINTMFSEIPRTTAAQAYRAYLGADISSYEGIMPVAGEPSDIDNKGVAEPRCASCHSTLDPLAYAFTKYEGIEQTGGVSVGEYDEMRPTKRLPGWSDEAQQPVVLGQEVSSVREWAEIAAESDAFKRNLAQLFFEHALSRGPSPDEVEEFTALWRALPEDDYSANRLIHRLADTAAFGVP